MTKKHHGIYFFPVLLIAVLAISGYFALPKLFDMGRSGLEYKVLAGTKPKDYRKLLKENPDLVGWIKVPGTKINYPVMQTPKVPQYYLHRDFHKRYSLSGCIFMDAKTDISRSKNYLIYGHHMQDGTMFGQLVKYSDPSFYKKHRVIYFTRIYKSGRYEKRKYRVFACYKTAENNRRSYLDYANITSRKKYDKFVRLQTESTEIKNSFTPSWDIDLLTLSTCSYHIAGHLGRYSLSAYRVY
jgi:sortase B